MTIPVVHKAEPNPHAARENREVFDALGIVCLNLMGATGVGKTALLEAVLPRLQAELSVGVLEGDLATTCDAHRISALGGPVVQVLTDGHCHLSAAQVQKGLAELPLAELDLLIIEDIGSPVCQMRSDFGEHLRVAALSIAAGHAVATKYPALFREAALIALTKYDLLGQVDFDLDQTVRFLGQINPRAEIICTDTRTRVGIDRMAGWILGYVRAQRLRHRRRSRASSLVGVPG